jgi:hypothetical protein
MAITKVVWSGRADTSASWGSRSASVIPDWVASTTQVLEQNMLYGARRAAHVLNHRRRQVSTTDNPRM